MAHVTPTWVERMSLHRWCAISGDHPDLELQATAPGTRYLVDYDPARFAVESGGNTQGAVATDAGARANVALARRCRV